MKRVAYIMRFVLQYPDEGPRPRPEDLIMQLQVHLALPQEIGEARAYAILGVDYMGEVGLPGKAWRPTKRAS